MSDRYQGKPLVRILECYALRAINELSADDEVKLEAMTPKLQEVYKIQGTWHEIIESVMSFPSDMPQKISALWSHNKELAKANDETLIPQHFAEMFVDKNLVS